MSVRNRISTFEAHNDEIRKSSTPLSPKSPSVASPHSSASGAQPRPPHTTSAASASASGSGGASHQNSPYGVVGDSPDRPASETIVASQMRTNRLQRQQSGSSGEMDGRSKNMQKTRRLMGVPDAAGSRSGASRPGAASDPSAASPGVSLFAHRRPSDNANNGPTSGGGGSAIGSSSSSSGRAASTHNSGQASSLSREAAEHSRRRMLMQPRLNHDDALQGAAHREEDHTYRGQQRQQLPQRDSTRAVTSTQVRQASAAAAAPPNHHPSAGTSSSRMGKMQRIKKMRNTDRQKSRDGLSNLDSASLNPSSSAEANGNDDDITLTSVRQIVGSSPTDLVDDGKDSFRSSSSPSTMAGSARKNAPDDENSQHLAARTNSLEEDEPDRGGRAASDLKWTQREVGEEKSDKAQLLQYQHQHQLHYHDPAVRRQLALQRSSSSEIDDTDGERSRDAATPANERMRQVMHGPSTSASQMTPDVAAFFERRRRQDYPRDDDSSSCREGGDDDDDEHHDDAYEFHTFESAKDDDDDDDAASHGSMSYSRRREMEARMEREKERRRAAAEAKSSEAREGNPFATFGLNNPFVKQEQVEDFRRKYDTPTNRAAAGVAVASTVGFLILGPVGLLVGAATVGIGAGVMQIPEEQRSNMYVKASEAAQGAHQTAIACTESLSNSCANTYENSVADHVPAEMKKCCTVIDEEVTKVVASSKGVVDGDGFMSDVVGNETLRHAELQGSKSRDGKLNTSPNHRFKNKKNNVACLRDGTSQVS
jgi:hypothetical protein